MKRPYRLCARWAVELVQNGLSIRKRVKVLPLPFAAEQDLEEGKFDGLGPLPGKPDGWYLCRWYNTTYFVWQGIAYQPSELFSAQHWYFELQVYEHTESCGVKHPKLRPEWEDRREVNRMLLQLDAFEEKMVRQDTETGTEKEI
jgi:hypothetical protein